MTRKSEKSYILILILNTIAAISAFSQKNAFVSREIDLAQEKLAQISVLGGNVLCQPVRTSYGYIAAGDAKQIYGFSPEGKLLWQRSFFGRLKPFITAGPADMVYAVTDDSRIGMMNSSGLILWKKKASFTIEDAPLCGAEGRVFVRGKNNISCYGLKGIRRWTISTELQDISIPLVPLNDGSLLVFLSRTDGGKSVAKRIDVFGTEKEEITFTGTVSQAAQCAEGAVLSFSDGSIGLCAANEKGAYSRWTCSSSAPGGAARLLCDPVSGLMAAIGKDRVSYIDVKTGKEISSFPVKTGAADSLYMAHTAQGLVLASKTDAACYQKDGTAAWSARFNPQKRWKFVYASDSGHLVFCMSDWILEVYQMKLNFSSIKNAFREQEVKSLPYSESAVKSSVFSGNNITEQLASQMKAGFESGGFGEYEEAWMSLLKGELDQMYSDWTQGESAYQREIPWFKANIPYCRLLLELESLSGVSFGRSRLATLIRRTEDPSLLIPLIQAAAEISFDPDGTFLSSIEYVLKTKAGKNDKVLLERIADATYEICRFMGRPAFFRKGHEILNYMLYPQFDKETKEYALLMLNRVIEAEL